MGWYNHQLTGDWLTTPYQVYTDQHTPCHVFGFDNVVRGEHWKAGMDPESRQRVLEHYDDWAKNLDAKLASGNVVSRLIESAKWTVGLVVLMRATGLDWVDLGLGREHWRSGLGYALWYAVLPSLRATSAATVQLSVPVLAALGGVALRRSSA